MNVLVFIQRLFQQDIPPSPPPSSGNTPPDDRDVRWAKAQRDIVIRRARELQVDVDLANRQKQ